MPPPSSISPRSRLTARTRAFPAALRLLLMAGAVTLALQAAGAPVTFAFTPPTAAADQELWARVVTPSGRTLTLPAFALDAGRFAVRARPDEVGTYRLDAVLAGPSPGAAKAIPASPASPESVAVDRVAPLPAITTDPAGGGFRDARGAAFVPVGSNLAWARDRDVIGYYRQALAAFGAAGLNWTRIWMAHWGGLNPDWLPEHAGPSPAPGSFDEKIAQRWDDLLALAEDHGIYVQLVLQHHGQVSTTVNPNWADHPWNAANPGGFLRRPADFFTDPRARELTRRRYRTLVARCAWSPAIFAWELFNEVHWVDALKLERNEAAVAAWHAEMADYLRSIDAYGHLVTTSTEDLRSPIYARMDFLQPHLYAADLLTGARRFAPRLAGDTRPVFYGEFGDDHAPVDAAVKASGVTEAPPIWAGLMGEGRLPAQPWEGWELLATGRLGELGAVRRFVEATGLADRQGLTPFSPAVSTKPAMRLVLPAGQHWQRRAVPDFVLPLDGRQPLELADWPAAFVTPASQAKDGFPDRATFHAEFPRDGELRLKVAEVAPAGGSLRVRIDDTVVARRAWPAGLAQPDELTIPVEAGWRTVSIENPGDADWVRLAEVDLGVDASVLSAFGQRNEDFIAVWIYHRSNLFSVQPGPPVGGELRLGKVAAGTWQVVRWDTLTGTPAPAVTVQHDGGPLRLSVDPIQRHAAFVLIRQP